jgi:hypothetical protein
MGMFMLGVLTTLRFQTLRFSGLGVVFQRKYFPSKNRTHSFLQIEAAEKRIYPKF